MNIHLIAATRPNFMKVAPLFRAMEHFPGLTPELIHTGQHYDANMSEIFFEEFEITAPKANLNVGSGSHAQQTGGVMIAYEKYLQENRADLVVVIGDVNSTIACALTAVKLGVPVAHLEAGLRSFDRTMPEEINRVLTDQIADRLWIPSPEAEENLLREGVEQSKISYVGNIMIDSLKMMEPKIAKTAAFKEWGLTSGAYGVATIHRPHNTDTRAALERVISTLRCLSRMSEIVLPLHPRTRSMLERFDLYDDLRHLKGLTLIESQGYLKFMSLVQNARFVVTDSGGVQEETTLMNVPCLTLRDNTERPITCTQGTNQLVNFDTIEGYLKQVLDGNWKTTSIPKFWDGQTAQRICEDLSIIF